MKHVLLPILIMFLSYSGTALADTTTPTSTSAPSVVGTPTTTNGNANSPPATTSPATNTQAQTQTTTQPATTNATASITTGTQAQATTQTQTTTPNGSTPPKSTTAPTTTPSQPPAITTPTVTPTPSGSASGAFSLPVSPTLSQNPVPELTQIKPVSMQEFENFILGRLAAIVAFARNISGSYEYVMLILGALVLVFPGGGPMKRRLGWGMVGSVLLVYLLIWWGPFLFGVIQGMATPPN